MWAKNKHQSAFTIVELLIVIVVIGILAAITIVSFNGVQARAYTAKAQADIASLKQAIVMARNNTGQVTGVITGSWGTSGQCMTLSSVTTKTSTCWTTYLTTLDKISTASGMNIRALADGRGYPYMLDENESEGGVGNCTKDYMGSFRQPFEGAWVRDNNVEVETITAGC